LNSVARVLSSATIYLVTKNELGGKEDDKTENTQRKEKDRNY
jgi:hypothetical protein